MRKKPKWEIEFEREMKARLRRKGEKPKPVRFQDSVRRGHDEYDRGTRRFILFEGDDGSEERGTVERIAREPWIYASPSCDPGQEARWKAAELRQIADKLDELNGEKP